MTVRGRRGGAQVTACAVGEVVQTDRPPEVPVLFTVQDGGDLAARRGPVAPRGDVQVAMAGIPGPPRDHLQAGQDQRPREQFGRARDRGGHVPDDVEVTAGVKQDRQFVRIFGRVHDSPSAGVLDGSSPALHGLHRTRLAPSAIRAGQPVKFPYPGDRLKGQRRGTPTVTDRSATASFSASGTRMRPPNTS